MTSAVVHIQTKKLQSNVVLFRGQSNFFHRSQYLCKYESDTRFECVCVCGMNFYGKIPSENEIYCLDRYLYYL